MRIREVAAWAAAEAVQQRVVGVEVNRRAADETPRNRDVEVPWCAPRHAQLMAPFRCRRAADVAVPARTLIDVWLGKPGCLVNRRRDWLGGIAAGVCANEVDRQRAVRAHAPLVEIGLIVDLDIHTFVFQEAGVGVQ